jgi:hypothetical protein
MLDFKKVNVIRNHLIEILKKQDSYNIYCNLNNVEITELSKYFYIEVIKENNNYKEIKFKLKQYA